MPRYIVTQKGGSQVRMYILCHLATTCDSFSPPSLPSLPSLRPLFWKARFLLSKVNPSQTHNTMSGWGAVRMTSSLHQKPYLTVFLLIEAADCSFALSLRRREVVPQFWRMMSVFRFLWTISRNLLSPPQLDPNYTHYYITNFDTLAMWNNCLFSCLLRSSLWCCGSVLMRRQHT